MNRGHTYRERLPASAAGSTLVDWLTRTYEHSTAAEWRERIDQGLVRVDETTTHADVRLRPGQRLEWFRPPWEEPDVPLHYDVVHEDDDLLVVDKPAGLPTMPAGGFLEHTLLALVRQRDAKWSAVHRLGRGTSGLVVFAAPHAAAATHALFRERRIEKRYLARVTGTLTPQTITAPIGRVPHPRMRELFAVTPGGAAAETIVERVDKDLATVRIVTGRPHQIRIHLAHVGCPLKDDPLYGAHGVLLDATPGDCGYFLRAFELVLPTLRITAAIDSTATRSAAAARPSLRTEPPAPSASSASARPAPGAPEP